MHHIISRNTTVFSENFFHIIHTKQKLQLSELKKDNFATAQTASLAQDWLSRNCPEFIRKEEWPPNSPHLNPLDYHVWGAMLDKYQGYAPKPTNIWELKTVLKAIWSDLPQGSIDEAVLTFRKRLQACIKAAGGHCEHAL